MSSSSDNFSRWLKWGNTLALGLVAYIIVSRGLNNAREAARSEGYSKGYIDGRKWCMYDRLADVRTTLT